MTDNCPICYEPLREDIYTTVCCHKFHKNCITKIFKDKCPLCRSKLHLISKEKSYWAPNISDVTENSISDVTENSNTNLRDDMFTHNGVFIGLTRIQYTPINEVNYGSALLLQRYSGGRNQRR